METKINIILYSFIFFDLCLSLTYCTIFHVSDRKNRITFSDINIEFQLKLLTSADYESEYTPLEKTIGPKKFYFVKKENATEWISFLTNYKVSDYFFLYFQDMQSFYENVEEINSKGYYKYISAIIIGSTTPYKKNETIQLLEKKVDIFINSDTNIIEKLYSKYNDDISCNIYYQFTYTGNIIAENLCFFFFIVIVLLLIIWLIILYLAKRNNNNIFIHGYILALFIFYFLSSLFLLLFFEKNEENKKESFEYFSGFLFNIFKFFLFFTKFLVSICISLQLNILELRDHYQLTKNSRANIYIFVICFFIISLQNENMATSEFCNVSLYLVINLSLLCLFCKLRSSINNRLNEALGEQPIMYPALKLKNKLLKIHTITIFLFDVSLTTIYLYYREHLNEYRTLRFILIFITYSDLPLVLLLTFIYFPRKLPEHYVEESQYEIPDFGVELIGNNQFNNIFVLNTKTDENIYFENYSLDEFYDVVLVENPFSEKPLSKEKGDKNKENINIENNSINDDNEDIITQDEENKKLETKDKINEDEENQDIYDTDNLKIGYIINDEILMEEV